MISSCDVKKKKLNKKNLTNFLKGESNLLDNLYNPDFMLYPIF